MWWNDTLIWSRGLGFIAGAALFWLQYFDLKDYLHPEPRRRLLLSYFLGAVSAGLGLALYALIEALGGPGEPAGGRAQILLYCFLVVGPVEEGAKFLIARIFIFRSLEFDEAIDGLIYSSAVSIGFASMESLIYFPILEWPDHLARTLTAPLTHSLFSSLWGFGVGIAFFRSGSRKARILWQLLPLAGAALVHGLYDYVLLAMNGTFLASGLALVLWMFLIGYARRLVQSRPCIK